jgi:DNA repair exonuclease SbcCD ATPase subunit
MTIKKLILKNFRSFKDCEISFNLINYIVPLDLDQPVDIGKTHIIRALKIILHHEPFTKQNVFYGEKEASITIELCSGHFIKREIKNSKNFTAIKYPGENEWVIYDGMKDVSTLVKSIIGINKVSFDDSFSNLDLNFIPAGSKPTLLEERSDICLRKISSILGGQKVEDAYTKLSSDKLKLAKEINTLKAKIDLTSKDLEEEANKVSLVKELLNYLTSLKQQILSKKSRLDTLVYYNQKLKTLLSFDYNQTKFLLEDLEKTFHSFYEEKLPLYKVIYEHKGKIEDFNYNFGRIVMQKEDLNILYKELEELLVENQDKICPTCGTILLNG